MPPDKAEKLVNQMKLGNSMFGHFQFTVTRIVGVDPEDHPDYDTYKKYMASEKHKKGIIEKNLRPIAEVKIKDNSIDFYVQKKKGNIKQFTSKSDFEYVTSLNISS